jgi:mRNA interferase MazF
VTPPAAPTPYVPDHGEVVWLDFSPQAGHEQSGHRPAIVLSPRVYNARAGLMICCPVTNKRKGYPLEVAVEAGNVRGVALADHVKSVDWQARNAVPIGQAKQAAQDVARLVAALIGAQ